MLISTPEELRAFLPSHVYRNIDPIRGFLQTSENTFLRQRIGQPLLDVLRTKYAEIGPIIPGPLATSTPVTSSPGSSAPFSPDDSGAAAEFGEGATTPSESTTPDPWPTLITLCQGCIVFDAFSRAADVHAVSVNDSGLNVAESEGYDSANDKRIDRYKAQLIKESHAAVDQLLIQLEEWEAQVGSSLPEADSGEGSSLPEAEFGEDPLSPIHTIINLWQQSPTHQLIDGLLFNTATEFHRYVDIYDSRDRFITLLPDIRFCQELHLEAELSPELLHYIIDEHRNGRYEGSEQKMAWMMLQRCLSLYVEARAKMFTRAEARDEATGYMRLTLAYLRRNQRHLAPRDIFAHSPLFEPHHWPKPEAPEAEFGEGTSSEAELGKGPSSEAELGKSDTRPTTPHHVAPNLHGHPVTHPNHGSCSSRIGDDGSMLITSII